MKQLNVLVVDDSIVAAKMLASKLSALGHKVVQMVSSGKDALPAYESCKPDLVTMDISMPIMDGIAATRSIIERYPDAQIIMATSIGQEKMLQDAENAGAKGYVIKPYQQDKLQEVIEKVFK